MIRPHYLATCLLISLSACKGIDLPTEDYLDEGSFTTGIEGPAFGPDKRLYVPNLHREGTIGVIPARGNAEIFMTLPEGSTGNSIRFDGAGRMFIADYSGHNVIEVDIGSRAIVQMHHDNRMNQPNDIAVARSGLIYATDPNWANESGQLWRLDLDGKFTLLETDMGTTNGIELNPEETRLYVNESVQRRVWVYDITPEGDLTNKRLFHQFDDYGLDGMKTDREGNLYIARYGAGRITVLSPNGEILQKLPLQGQYPTNLALQEGSPFRIFVTMQQRGTIEVLSLP